MLAGPDYSESGVFEMENENQQIRIVQETVAGKEITFAHVMGGPAPIIYQKLGLNPQVDYRSSAIGIMNSHVRTDRSRELFP